MTDGEAEPPRCESMTVECTAQSSGPQALCVDRVGAWSPEMQGPQRAVQSYFCILGLGLRLGAECPGRLQED